MRLSSVFKASLIGSAVMIFVALLNFDSILGCLISVFSLAVGIGVGMLTVRFEQKAGRGLSKTDAAISGAIAGGITATARSGFTMLFALMGLREETESVQDPLFIFILAITLIGAIVVGGGLGAAGGIIQMGRGKLPLNGNKIYIPLTNTRIIILALTFLIVGLCIYFVIPNVDQKIVQAAVQACKRIPVPEAAVYTAGPGLHPVVLVTTSNGGTVNSNSYPDKWLPGSVSEIQLVACVGEEDWRLIETCKYINGPNVLRYQSYAKVEVVEARTGVFVQQFTIEGDRPRQCRQSEDASLTELRGYSVWTPDTFGQINSLVDP